MDADRHLLNNLMLARGVVDRAAEHRGDPEWLAVRRADPRSRVLQVCEGAARVTSAGPEGVGLAFLPVDDIAPDVDLTLLGVDDEDVAYFADHAAGT